MVLSLTHYSYSSNSTIVPLFEKVLSASDAGRIGRLVLPKACAEVRLTVLSSSCATICNNLFVVITVTVH